MRYVALATDFDGTLAHHGLVDDSVIDALRRLRTSGRKVLMVTGRELVDLARVFPHLELFDAIVVENGATLYSPATGEEQKLAEPPPATFVDALRSRGVGPISVGRVVVATWSPHETAVLETIRDLGLELQVIFNKGAVMVLPTGVNKATGLKAALKALHISPHNVVSVGDAENDHALLSYTEAGVAVANGVPTLLERADLVTSGDHGRGVIELIDRLVNRDLEELSPRLARHEITIGCDSQGKEVRIAPVATNVLVTGTAEAPALQWARGMIATLTTQRRQMVVIDPVGDLSGLLGDSMPVVNPSEVERVISALEEPRHSLLLDLRSIPADRQLPVLETISRQLSELRMRTGHPHWVIVNRPERIPAAARVALQYQPALADSVLVIATAESQAAVSGVVGSLGLVVCCGDHAREDLAGWLTATEVSAEAPHETPSGESPVWAWTRTVGAPFALGPMPGGHPGAETKIQAAT